MVVTGPVGDARWRGVPKSVKTINRTRLHEQQQKARPAKPIGDRKKKS